MLRPTPTLSRPGENQLVVETWTVQIVPEVADCQGPSDQPTVSDLIADPVVHSTPAEGLEAYVESVDPGLTLATSSSSNPTGRSRTASRSNPIPWPPRHRTTVS